MFNQKDGCPAQFKLFFVQVLDQQFAEICIYWLSPIHYLYTSLDVTTFDFYLWSTLREQVYSKDLLHATEVFKETIQEAINY